MKNLRAMNLDFRHRASLRGYSGCLFEFLANPAREGFDALAASKKLPHNLFSWHRAARLKYGLAIFRRNRVFEQVCPVELVEEIERNHLVIKIGVVVR